MLEPISREKQFFYILFILVLKNTNHTILSIITKYKALQILILFKIKNVYNLIVVFINTLKLTYFRIKTISENFA